MCQVNTEPMMSQTHQLQVVGNVTDLYLPSVVYSRVFVGIARLVSYLIGDLNHELT